MKKAMFPGSFDPFHEGHLDILKKALNLFDKVFLVITFNNEKENYFLENRKQKIIKQIQNIQNVEIIINSNKMTWEWAKENNIEWIIRSARNDLDYNYELQLASGNNHFWNKLETIIIIPNYKNINFHSRLIKQKGNK